MAAPVFTGMGDLFIAALKEAENATFKPQTGPQVLLAVIFNDRFVDIDVSGVAYGAPRPVAFFRTGTIAPKHGDVLQIGAIEYKVRSVEPDGHEMTKVELSI